MQQVRTAQTARRWPPGQPRALGLWQLLAGQSLSPSTGTDKEEQMIQQIEFVVLGQPIGKGRPRFTRQGRVFTPAKTKEYEDRIKVQAVAAMEKAQRGPTTMPCSVKIVARFEIPKSWPKYKKEAAQADKGGYKPGKPDIDNIAKAVLDACNGITFTDDSLVSRLEIEKSYAVIVPALYVTVFYDE